jgi:hypothetical protein
MRAFDGIEMRGNGGNRILEFQPNESVGFPALHDEPGIPGKTENVEGAFPRRFPDIPEGPDPMKQP